MSVGGDLGHHPAGHSRLSWRLDRALAGRALVAGDRADDVQARASVCRSTPRMTPPVPRRGRKDDR